MPAFAPSPSCASPPCSTPSSNPWPPSPPFDPRRWRVELYFNDLKTTRQASRRRDLTPGLIRRELLPHAVAYNLIRRILLQSASQHAAPLDQLRCKGTLATGAPEARLRVEIVGAASETRASRTRKERERRRVNESIGRGDLDEGERRHKRIASPRKT